MSEIRVDTISEKTSANGVAVDGVTLKDGGIAATAGSTITVTDNSDALTLKTTDADANIGPILLFNRDSASPADNDFLGAIDFQGDNDAGETHDYIRILSRALDVSNGAEKADLVIKDATGNNIVNMAHTEIVFNDDSVDRDFRIESNALSHAFFIDGGTDHVSMGNSSTSLYTLDVKQNADFTGSNSDTANEAPLRVWSTHNNGRGAIAIGGNNNNGIFNKGANDLVVQGYNSVTFDVSTTNDDKFGTKTERFRISGSGTLGTGAETDPDVSAGGITLQQNAEDGNILTFKSSDVAHGITNTAETDTYFEMRKQSASIGGVTQTSYSEQKLAHAFEGFVGLAEESSPSAASFGPFYFNASIKSGTSIVEMSASQHLFAVANDGDAKFMIDGDGTFHSDGAGGTYDTYEDAQLVRAFDLSHMEGVINSKFDKFVQYNHEDLAAAKLVGREPDGTPNHFINYPAFNRLHNGAIWQQYEKTERLANAMYELAKIAVGEEKANKILEKNEIKLLN